MTDVFSSAAGGIAAAANRFEASAKRVAEDPQSNLAGELVEQKLAGVAVEANIAVLNAANRMTKSLLDILV